VSLSVSPCLQIELVILSAHLSVICHVTDWKWDFAGNGIHLQRAARSGIPSLAPTGNGIHFQSICPSPVPPGNGKRCKWDPISSVRWKWNPPEITRFMTDNVTVCAIQHSSAHPSPFHLSLLNSLHSLSVLKRQGTQVTLPSTLRLPPFVHPARVHPSPPRGTR
jgi:hypothetical protein